MNMHSLLFYKNKRWLRTLRYFLQASRHKLKMTSWLHSHEQPTRHMLRQETIKSATANLKTFLYGWFILFLLLFLLISFSLLVSKHLAPHLSLEGFFFLYQNPFVTEQHLLSK
ncbi:hypothetical protein BegalDRAFT_0080 [Beggiatoa alba B18LD]|uniref:Uncharacterized protein n=1 Tax=Beggiatoa alba B18LD TaxID=395493 RepID=I3CBL1_9GAMM|nr:hypothetical protein [Beggiatoa alba]EIJ41004.1 hypothetical protein BegalDRAFT_0080 [Beggiatoa alba B18LD]